MSAHQKLTPQPAQDAKAPQTTTQRTAAHRRRMAEKMARYEGALREIDALADLYATDGVMSIVGAIVDAALNPILTADVE